MESHASKGVVPWLVMATVVAAITPATLLLRPFPVVPPGVQQGQGEGSAMQDLTFILKDSRGTEWLIYTGNNAGLCAPNPTIYVCTATKGIEGNGRGQKLLNTWVHELIHAEQTDFKEHEVEKLADFVSAALWKAGYRNVLEMKETALKRSRKRQRKAKQ